MKTIGKYSLTQAVAATGPLQVWRALPSGGETEHEVVLKICRPNPSVLGERGAAEAVRHFMDRAAVQHRARAAGATHWAPVREVVNVNGGGYVVMPYYPRSAKRLIDSKVKAGGDVLLGIVSDVVKGLVELRQHLRRSHGNLKASNVLIPADGVESGVRKSGGSTASPTAVLTDPAPYSRALSESSAEAADLDALGQLIYELVTHKKFKPSAWPIGESEEWTRLGKPGEQLRQLCIGLIHPEPEERMDRLRDAVQILDQSEVRRPQLLTNARLAAAATAAAMTVVIAVGLVVSLSGRSPSATARAGEQPAWAKRRELRPAQARSEAAPPSPTRQLPASQPVLTSGSVALSVDDPGSERTGMAASSGAPAQAVPAAAKTPVAKIPPPALLPEQVKSVPAGAVLKVAYQSAPPVADIGPASETRRVDNPAADQVAPPPRVQGGMLVRRWGHKSFEPLQDGAELASSRDEYVIGAKPCTTGYLYVFQVDTTGHVDWLFPRNDACQYSSGTNPVHPGRAIRLPASNGRALTLDRTTGVEHVYFVFSAVRWPELESTLLHPVGSGAAGSSATVAVRGTRETQQVATAHIHSANGLGLRGVGGEHLLAPSATAELTQLFPGDPVDTGQADIPNTPAATPAHAAERASSVGGFAVQAAGSFVVAERWFRHVE